MRVVIFVATGSGIGGVLRYLMQMIISRRYPSPFPAATMTVNIVGCFAIGVFFALFEKGLLINQELRLFLLTGICGGFTTFSAFALENILLLRSGNLLYFSLYAAGSVVAGILATIGGIQLVRVAG